MFTPVSWVWELDYTLICIYSCWGYLQNHAGIRKWGDSSKGSRRRRSGALFIVALGRSGSLSTGPLYIPARRAKTQRSWNVLEWWKLGELRGKCRLACVQSHRSTVNSYCDNPTLTCSHSPPPQGTQSVHTHCLFHSTRNGEFKPFCQSKPASLSAFLGKPWRSQTTSHKIHKEKDI